MQMRLPHPHDGAASETKFFGLKRKQGCFLANPVNKIGKDAVS
jgi:hypothetical protein